MQGRILSGDNEGLRSKGEGARWNHFIFLRSLAGPFRRAERAVCRKPLNEVEAMEEMINPYGINRRIRYADAKRRSFHLDGYREGLPTLQIGTADVRLVPLPVRRALLPLRRSPVWLGAIPLVVHTVDGPFPKGAPIKCYARAGVLPRLLNCSEPLWGRCCTLALRKGMSYSGTDNETARLAQASYERNWEGHQVVEHLGVILDSRSLRFFITPRKIRRARQLSGKLLREVRNGRRWVSQKPLAYFCGVCVSLTLGMPWARYYTRSLYWEMSARRKRDARGRIRLSRQSIKDLQKWRELSRNELQGRPMVPPLLNAVIHSDAADLGYGGTWNVQDFRAGVDGLRSSQGIWDWRDRAKSISFRELKAIRLLLLEDLVQR